MSGHLLGHENFNGRLARQPFAFSIIPLTVSIISVIYAGALIFYDSALLAMSRGRFDAAVLLTGHALFGISMAIVGFIYLVWKVTGLVVRRLHDINLSGHYVWYVIVLALVSQISFINTHLVTTLAVGFVNYSFNIWLMITPGSSGSNRFGNSVRPAQGGQTTLTMRNSLLLSGLAASAILGILTILDPFNKIANIDLGIEDKYETGPLTNEQVLAQIAEMQVMFRQPEADKVGIFDARSERILEYVLGNGITTETSFAVHEFSSGVVEQVDAMRTVSALRPEARILLLRLRSFQKEIIEYLSRLDAARAATAGHSVTVEDVTNAVVWNLSKTMIVDDYNQTEALLRDW